VDILNGSPLLDIKPYVPYADSVPHATEGWITNEIERYPVQFSEGLLSRIKVKNLEPLIIGVLEWDPRPRSQREQLPIGDPRAVGKRFAFRLMGYDIHWEIIESGVIRVVEVRDLPR